MMSRKELTEAVAYFRTSSATKVGDDKDRLKRLREAVAKFAKAVGRREGAKATRRRLCRKPLDRDTLACAREPGLPFSRLESRLMRPACGSRSVTVAFSRAGDPALGDFEDAVILKTVGEVDSGLLAG
jgi:hypothetical protein